MHVWFTHWTSCSLFTQSSCWRWLDRQFEHLKHWSNLPICSPYCSPSCCRTSLLTSDKWQDDKCAICFIQQGCKQYVTRRLWPPRCHKLNFFFRWFILCSYSLNNADYVSIITTNKLHQNIISNRAKLQPWSWNSMLWNSGTVLQPQKVLLGSINTAWT